jgi:hypothetical protein
MSRRAPMKTQGAAKTAELTPAVRSTAGFGFLAIPSTVTQVDPTAISLPKFRLFRKKAIRKPRIGAAKLEFGEFVIPDSFFEPLPDEILKAFTGSNASD